MGGSALSVPTRRYAAAEFHALETRLIEEWGKAWRADVRGIPAYRTKPDFGDLDLLVEEEAIAALGGPNFLRDWVKTHAFCRDVYCERNSPVFSFDYRESEDQEAGFQVDLILTPRSEMDVAQAYFSYNDLGNLIGRVAHRMGFSHGHRGLLYPVREGTHFVKNVLVSQNLDEILPFLGYATGRFREGFDSLEDIFRYTVSSPYFNTDIFLLENRNHTARTRDRKRPTYRKFLEWVNTQTNLPSYPWCAHDDEAGRAQEKAFFLTQAQQRFPQLASDIEAAWEEIRRRQEIRSKSGGRERVRQIAQWIGLDGKDLAQFMASFQQHHLGGERVAAWMAEREEAVIRAEMLKHREVFKVQPSVRGPRVR